MSERLGGSSFESGFEARSELSPDRLLLEQARSAAYEMLRNHEDALTREIAEKILAKAEMKDRVDSLHAHADDTAVYQEYKKLGIFVVRDAEATFDYDDSVSGFSISKGDEYLDLHLPPVPQELRSRDTVRASLGLISDYIAQQNLNPRYVMGVTYERMARVAQRFGFTVAHPSAGTLPEGVVRGVERVYQGFTQAGMDGSDMGLPAIVFQDTDDFMERNSGLLVQRVTNLAGFAVAQSVEL